MFCLVSDVDLHPKRAFSVCVGVCVCVCLCMVACVRNLVWNDPMFDSSSSL